MISKIRVISIIFLLFFAQGFFVSSHCQGSEADRSFTIQVLFGAVKDDASRCLKKLKKKGHEAYIYETTNEVGEKFYRVRIGQFKTDREARAYADKLEQENMNYWIVPVPSLLNASHHKKDPVSNSNQTAVSSTLHNPISIRAAKTDTAERPVSDKGIETDAMDNASIEEKSETEETAKASDMDRVDNREKPITDKRTSAEEDWPSSLSTVYKYYDHQRTLHVTNSFKKIPVQFRGSIKEIQIFPVRFISLDALQRVFNIEIEGEKKNIKLTDIKETLKPFSEKSVSDFKEFLKPSPLRLVYDPDRIGTQGMIHGTLYFRSGVSVGLEMVQRGLAPCNPQGLTVFKRKMFLDAEEEARSKKIGIWAIKSNRE